MPKADRDLATLTVLALLLTGPRHTYEMHRMMIDTHKDFVTGLPRSMYHAVEKLQRDGLIGVQRVDREGTRPERTIYELTDRGRVELRERVSRLLEHPEPDATLMAAALSFAGCLPSDRAAESLRARTDALTEKITDIEVSLASVPERLPRLLLIEAEYERARLVAERAWVNALIDDIRGARLDWPDDIGLLVDLIPADGGEDRMG